MEQYKTKVFKLVGKVQHYAWGGFSFIPQLLNISNAENKPFAEYWMGAHDYAASELIINDKKIKINDYIKSFPQETLGKNHCGKIWKTSVLIKNFGCKRYVVHPGSPDKKKCGKRIC